ncbi:hypothetical protein [Maricaulis sp. W15]|uniref:hypothetical protein n=1 Tax=Maricaulis sp. W15 TaxID=1772333 RepID=UPI00117C4BBF|nr:hypothetical protein [Maricaulis sp. W15]
MSLGYSKEFNDATRPGFDPDAAEAAMRRLKDAQDMQDQRAFQRQLSGVAEGTGEISQAVGAARQTAEDAAKADERERKERTDRAVMLDALSSAQDSRIAERPMPPRLKTFLKHDLATHGARKSQIALWIPMKYRNASRARAWRITGRAWKMS